MSAKKNHFYRNSIIAFISLMLLFVWCEQDDYETIKDFIGYIEFPTDEGMFTAWIDYDHPYLGDSYIVPVGEYLPVTINMPKGKLRVCRYLHDIASFRKIGVGNRLAARNFDDFYWGIGEVQPGIKRFVTAIITEDKVITYEGGKIDIVADYLLDRRAITRIVGAFFYIENEDGSAWGFSFFDRNGRYTEIQVPRVIKGWHLAQTTRFLRSDYDPLWMRHRDSRYRYVTFENPYTAEQRTFSLDSEEKDPRMQLRESESLDSLY